MIQIERYSNTGFKPCYQRYHLNKIMDYVMPYNPNKFKSKKYSMLNKNQKEFMQNFYKEEHEKYSAYYLKHFEDFKYGIWVFKRGEKSRLLLNHLNNPVKRSYGEVSGDIIAYSPDMKERGSLEYILDKYMEAYIPKRYCSKIEIIIL